MKKFMISLLAVAMLGVASLVVAQKPAVDAGSNKNLTGFVEICGSCINSRQYCRIFHNNRIIYSYYLPCGFNAVSIGQGAVSSELLDILNKKPESEMLTPIWESVLNNT